MFYNRSRKEAVKELQRAEEKLEGRAVIQAPAIVSLPSIKQKELQCYVTHVWFKHNLEPTYSVKDMLIIHNIIYVDWFSWWILGSSIGRRKSTCFHQRSSSRHSCFFNSNAKEWHSSWLYVHCIEKQWTFSCSCGVCKKHRWSIGTWKLIIYWIKSYQKVVNIEFFLLLQLYLLDHGISLWRPMNQVYSISSYMIRSGLHKKPALVCIHLRLTFQTV